MANYYLITVDRDKSTVSLHEYIKNNPKFTDWWHYITSTYIVETNDNLAGVQADIQNKWPNNRYFIIKVDPRYNNGWLNKDAYKWFEGRGF